MKTVVLCLTVLGLTQAVPAGVYHQEYNYKTSASSYRNNELQHKTDDEGYYAKDGDLEGRVKPRVQANSEHSEYVNPKLQDYNTGFYGGANGDTSSYGHLRAENTYGGAGSAGYSASSAYGGQSQYGGQYQSEGLASSDHISSPYGTYGVGSGGQTAYGSASTSSSAANLRVVTSRLEQELQRELQDTLYRNSHYSQTELENELRRNLTQRIQDALQTQYGQQSIRGGMSYTITGGRVQSTPNYQQQELESLKNQLENNLLQTLRTEYRRRSGSVSTSQHQVYDQNYVHQTTTTYRPQAYTSYPILPSRGQQQIDVDTRPVYHPDTQPVYHNGGSASSHRYEQEQSNYQRVHNVRYTPVPNPESITTIASAVQHEMDARLNRLLDDAQRQYFSQDTRYSLQSLDSILDRLREELRSNITYHMDEAIRRQYGNQVQRNGYMYTLGPEGQFSDQHNYRVADLDSLRRQVENNLIEKLNRDFQTYRTRYQTQTKQAYVEENRHGYNEYTTVRAIPFHHGVNTPTYDEDYYQPGLGRPTSASIVPVIGAGVKGGRYNYAAGASHGGYEVSSGGNIAELQQQLQADLSRQLQAAISKQRYSAQAYSQSGHSVPSYETSYQRLYDELNRNLTRQLEEFEAGSSYSAYGSRASGGAAINDAQLASLRSQLQNNLAGQLQQGLRQTYSSSSSYSASSSHSSGGSGAYRQVRGSDLSGGLGGYGQYRSGGGYVAQGLTQGEDCLGDDPNAYNDNYRSKRSYNTAYGYRSRPLGLSASTGTGSNYGGSGSVSLGRNQPQTSQYGQAEDNSDLTQQLEINDDLTQHLEDQDLTQQVEDNQDLTQQVENEDLTQHVQDLGQKPNHQDLTQQIEDNQDLTQQVEDLGQQTEDQDLTQQVQEEPIGKLEFGGQSQTDLGQQTEDETNGSHNIHMSAFNVPNNKPSEDYFGGQHVEDDVAIGALQFGQHKPREEIRQTPSQHGQYHSEDTSDLTQQVETDDFQHPAQHTDDVTYGKLNIDSQVSSSLLGQQENLDTDTQQKLLEDHQDQDLTQQVETDDFGKLQLGSQVNSNKIEGDLQEINHQDQDLTQQVEKDDFGKLQVGSQVNSNKFEGDLQEMNHQDQDLTQQVETDDFGKLQAGSQVNSNKFGGDLHETLTTNPSVSDDDLLTQQLDNISEKLEGDIRKPNAPFLGQTEENIPSGYIPKPNVQQVSSTSKPDPTYTSNAYLNLQTPTQTKLKQQLEQTLRKQLEKTVTNEYEQNTLGAHSYQKLSVELSRNISKEIERNLLQNSAFSANFHTYELRKLQSQLEYELNRELKLSLETVSQLSTGEVGSNGSGGELRNSAENPEQGPTDDNTPQYNRHRHHHSFGHHQHSFLDGERNSYYDHRHSYTHDRPYSNPTNEFTQATSLRPLTLGTSSQTKPFGADDLTQQQEYIESQQGLTQQQENLSPHQQGNVGFGGQTQEEELTPQQPLTPHGSPQTSPAFDARYPQYQYGYQYNQNRPRVWNPVPPKYVPYAERPRQNAIFTPEQSISSADTFGPPGTAYQAPQNQFPTHGSASMDYPVPGYQRPTVGTYPPHMHFQTGEPVYVPRSPPMFANEEKFVEPNQFDDQTNVSPLQVPSDSQTNLNFQVTQPLPTPNTPQTQSGFEVSSNGNIYAQQQSLSEAQRQSNRLIEQIRQAQRRRYPNSGFQGQTSIDVAPEDTQVVQKPGSDSLVRQQTVSDLPQPSLSAPTDQQFGTNNQFGQQPNSGFQIDQEIQKPEVVNQEQLTGSDVTLDVHNQKKIQEGLKEELRKQLLTAIDNYCTIFFAYDHPNKRGYEHIYGKVREEIKNNVTEILISASEPGQNAYSDLIPSNVNNKQEYFKYLQQELETELCKILEKEIDKKINTAENEKAYLGSRHRHRYNYQYGRQDYTNQYAESVSEIQPIQPQQASEVFPVRPQPQFIVPQPYNNNVGVKGHYSRNRNPPMTNTFQVGEKPFVQDANNGNVNSEVAAVTEPNRGVYVNNAELEQVELLSTTEKPLSWWQNFGNKVKSGASKLKEKIVGPSSQ